MSLMAGAVKFHIAPLRYRAGHRPDYAKRLLISSAIAPAGHANAQQSLRLLFSLFRFMCLYPHS